MEDSNQRFKTLVGFGKFFSFVGWVFVVIGGVSLILAMSQAGRMSRSFGGGEMLLMAFVPAVVSVLSGLLMVAGGQSISCFVSIEQNTHATMLAQQTFLSFMREQRASVVTSASASPSAQKKIEKEAAFEAPQEARMLHCSECGAALREQEVYRHRSKIYCEQHYEKAIS